MQNPGHHEELRDDKFIAAIMQFGAYAQQNYTKLLAGAAGIAVLVLVGVFLQNQAVEKQQAAVDLLGQVQVHILNNANGEAILAAERIIDQYPDSKPAGQALLVLGNLYFDLKRTSEAQAAFRKYLDTFGDQGPGGYAAWSGMATTYEQMGNLAEAAREYRSFAERHPASAFAPVALAEAARCHRLAGDTTEAAAIYREIVRTHPASTQRQLAESELSLMGEASS